MHDLSLLLQKYQQDIEEIKNKVSSALNCLPFRKAIVSFHINMPQRKYSLNVRWLIPNKINYLFLQLGNGAAFLMREYVKYNLYDRISTRPFLAVIEKKWIAFQILLALHHCHKVGVSGVWAWCFAIFSFTIKFDDNFVGVSCLPCVDNLSISYT